MLLERDGQLQLFHGLLEQAARGCGHSVVIAGEAGIGKTALARAFISDVSKDVRVLKGACEDLSIAEPLAPLRDLAREAAWQLPQDIVSEGDRLGLFSEALKMLTGGDRPTLILVEDVHWADDATLDFLRFLTRRIEDRSILLLMTSRDDALEGRPQIRRIVGALSSDTVTRLQLPPLSRAAVTRLSSDASRNAEAIYGRAGGNPFYVTELLRNGAGDLPISIQDSVLTRADALPPEARKILDAISIFPRRAESRLVEAIMGDDFQHIDACIDAGLVEEQDDFLLFRHELARQAVEERLSRPARRALNRALLSLLLNEGNDQHARLLHHAVASGDQAAIRRLAPQAADEAFRLRALREATGYLRLSLDHHEDPSDPAHCELLQKFAWTSYLIGENPQAIEAEKRALAFYRNRKDVRREGDSLRRLSRYFWVSAKGEQAREHANAALRTLANNRGAELAMAYSNVAQLAMLDHRYDEVAAPSEAAIQLAEEFNRPDILAHALNNRGMSFVWTAPDRGRAMLERSLRTAKEIDSTDDIARAYTNWAYFELYRLNFARSIEIATQGIAYCRSTDQDGFSGYLTGTIAWSLIQQGKFDAAAEYVSRGFIEGTSLAHARHHMYSGAIAKIWLSLRRGDLAAEDAIGFVDDFMSEMDELQRADVMAEVMAERAWLGQIPAEAAIEALSNVLGRAKDIHLVPFSALWMHKLAPHRSLADSEHLLEPVRHQIRGNWREAAAAWSRKGARFFEALALAEGDLEARTAALQLLTTIGAKETLKAVQRDMRADGLAVNIGPRRSTLENPAGLTRRQLDVLVAINDGLSNAEIADRLFIAPKTVDHHVSAILAKLDVKTRGEAAAHARDAGWL